MTARWRLRQYESLESTSDLCIALARQGEPDGLAVLAGRQTRGRGSRGRDWTSPPGNLYLSVLIRPDEDTREVGRWSLLAGVALARSLRVALDDPAPTVKWPNDLLLDGRKVAGVLLDTAVGAEGRVDWLVIGMGVNLAAAPVVPGRATAALAEWRIPPPPEAFAETVLASLDQWRDILSRDGFAPVRDTWLSHAPAIGSDIVVKMSDRTVSGRFAGLADDGSLRVQSGGGLCAITTGEVLCPERRPVTGRA